MKQPQTRDWIRNLIQSWFSRPRQLQRKPRRVLRLRVETLEDRVVPSSWVVTNTSTSATTSGSLPWAVAQANTDTSNAAITFNPTDFASATTITLTSTLTLSNTAYSITISGSGTGPITVSGGGAVRVFNVNASVTADLSSITITGGRVNGSSSDGGGIDNAGTLTLTNDVLTANTVGFDGGGIYNSGTATLTDDTLSGNSAPGGALNGGGGAFNTGMMTVADSTITANSTSYNGAGLDNDGTMIVTDSTFSANVAGYGGALETDDGRSTAIGCTFTGNDGSSFGGAAMLSDNGSPTTLTMIDCTLTGNSSQTGGAIATNDLTNLTVNLINSTISGNSASGSVGGVYLWTTGTVATFYNTMVAGNSVGASESDVSGVVSGKNNLIGNGSGMSGLTNGSNGNQVGTSTSPINPLLGPLQFNGGPTQTMVPQSSSPAVATGGALTTTNAAISSTSATSITVASSRVFAASSLPTLTSGSYCTIQIDGEQMTVMGVTITGTSATLTVTRGANGTTAATHSTSDAVYLVSDQRNEVPTYSSTAVVNMGAVQNAPITSALAFTTQPISTSTGSSLGTVTVTDLNGSTPVTGITVTVTIAGTLLGTTTAVTNSSGVAMFSNLTVGTAGTYTMTASASGAAGATSNSFTISLAPPDSVVVTTNSDAVSHTGTSLRDAIATADTDAAAGQAVIITFASSLNGDTITQVQGTWALNAPSGVAITISGAGQITVAGAGSNVFQVNAGTDVAFTGLQITGTSASTGIVASGAVSLANSIISGNSIGVQVNSGGTLTAADSTLWNDTGGLNAGGICNNGQTLLINCTLSNDYFAVTNNGAATLEGCTLVGDRGGDGVVYNNAGSMTISNCTLTDDSVSNEGGAICNFATMTVSNSTIHGNTAAGNSGGVCNFGTMAFINTIVAGNSAAGVASDIGGSDSVTGSFNFVGVGASGLVNGTNGNQVGTAASPLNPQLSALGNYGGATDTMPLQTGSSALGTGGAGTQLSAAITAATTSIPVANAVVFAAATLPTLYSGFYFTIQIGAEQMDVIGVIVNSAGTGTLTVVRAANSTLAATHVVNASVYLVSDERGDLAAYASSAVVNMGAYQGPAVAPATLAFTTQPISTMAGSSLGAVTVTDFNGSTPAAGVTVTVVSSGTLSGSTTAVTNSSGVATFSNLSMPAPGTYTLTASVPGATGATSNWFTISAGSPVSLVVTTISDAVSHTGTSLRDAVAAADTDAAAGHLASITFASSLNGQTITLAQGVLALTGSTGGEITINGGGAISINGNNLTKIMTIGSGADVALTGLILLDAETSSLSGAVTNSGNLTIDNCTVSGTGGGPAVFNSATLTVNDSVISGNSSGGGAAAIYNTGTLVVFDTTMSGNSTASNSNGGAVYSEGTATFIGDTISNNRANGGGGVQNNGGVMTIADSTIYDNTISSTSSPVYGGGIYVSDGTVNIINSTIYDNTCDTSVAGQAFGGGIYESGASLTLLNSIVSGNTASGSGLDFCQSGGTLIINRSLIGNTAGSGISSTSGTGNILNPASAGLGTFGNNGGPTQTIPLLSGSPAISAGSSVAQASAMAISDATVTVADGSVFTSSSLPAMPQLTFTTQPTSTSAGSVLNPITVQELAMAAYFYIQIDGEEMAVTGLTRNGNGSATLNVIRGVNGTTAATHAANASVYLVSDQRGEVTSFQSPAAVDVGAYQSTASSPAALNSSPVVGATVTIAISTGTLNGTPTATTNSSGVATFSNLSVPSGGTYTLTATSGVSLVSSSAFTITGSSSSPTLTSVSPVSGSTGGGTTVTITGTNFTGATAVNFGSTAAANFTVNSAAQITAVSPAETAGTIDVTVTTPSGTSAISSADQFNFLAPATVTSVSPNSGNVSGGNSVTITGTNFLGTTAVDFGTVAASNVNVVSATQITAVAPAEAAATVNITVTTPAGTSATSSSDQFTYTNTSIVVTTASDAVSHTGVSLRDAIATANTDAAAGMSATITFAPTLNGQTISLIQGALTLSGTGHLITINGAGQIDVNGTGNNGASDFIVDSNAQALIEGLTISGVINTTGNIYVASGVQNSGALELSSCQISGNTVDNSPAAIYNTAQMTLSNCLISGNSTGGPGCIVSDSSETLMISNCNISGNTAGAGQVDAGGTLIVLKTSITNNTNPTGGDCGIRVIGSAATIINSTISDNNGVGVYVDNTPANTTMIDCTISGNSDGGIEGFVFNSGTLTLSNCTVVGNSLSGGAGAGIQDVPTVVLSNSIVAGNLCGTTPGDISATVSGNNNVIGVSTGMTGITNGSNGNQVGTAASPLNPLLNALNNNGGATQTMSEQASSPARGAGSSLVQVYANAAVTTTSATSVTVTDGLALAATFLPAMGQLSFTAEPTNTAAGSNISPAVTVQNLDAAAYFYIRVDGEEMAVTGLTLNGNGTATLTVVRGANNTTAATHAANAPVYLVSDQRGEVTGFNSPAVVDSGAYQSTGSSPAPLVSSYVVGATITIAISSSSLNGNTTATTNSSGLATFGNLSVLTNGTYTLTATSGASAAYSSSFTINGASPPTVTSVNPGSGSTSGGAIVTITGTGFSGATVVRFGTTNATAFTVNSSTQITATDPAGTGTVDVTVVTAGGTSATSSADQFSYFVVPTVTSSSANLPDNAASVTITGTGFDTNTANDTVTFNEGVAGTVTAATATQLTVSIVTPPTALGSLTATVTTDGESSGAAVSVATVVNGDWIVTDPSGAAGSLTDVTLPYAVTHALNGDQITFASGLTGENIYLSSPLTINSNDTIIGPATGTVTLEGTLAVASGATVNEQGNLTIGSSGDLIVVGVLNIYGTVEISSEGGFNDEGTVNVEAGGTLSDQDSITVTAGGILNDFGNVTEGAGGALTVESGGTLNAYGTVTIEAGAAYSPLGTVNIEPGGALYLAPVVTSSTAGMLVNTPTLTINGYGFDPTAGNNTVTFNDGAAGTVTSATATTLVVTFTTQPSAAGSLTAVVTTDSLTSGSAAQVATVSFVTSVVVNGDYAPIVDISSDGVSTVTVTTDGNNGFTAGNTVVISRYTGANAGYDGTFTVQSASGDQFTVTNTTPGLPVLSGNSAGFAVSQNTASDLVGLQRSMVDSVVYTFTSPVSLTASNFTLTTSTPSVSGAPSQAPAPTTLVPGMVLTSLSGGSIWVVSWVSGGGTGATVTGHSLADGVYNITLGNSNEATDTFYRLYGDVAGYNFTLDRACVYNADSLPFTHSYLLSTGAAMYLADVDYDANGLINNSDSLNFTHRYMSLWTGFMPTI